jgi:SSS family solute:Na+ symporter
MISLSTGDILLIAGYGVLVLVIGFLSGRHAAGSGAVEYLLAGRSLTVPLFVMTLVSTWYGGILGVGEFSYRFGISNWLVQGVPYYIFAVLFALFLARRIRQSNLATIPDRLAQVYDRRTAILGAVLTFLLSTPAPYVLMLALLLQLVTGWSLTACLLVGTMGAVSYLFTGGFRSDVYTDVFEFFLMFIGFAVILPFAYVKFGGLSYLESALPAEHLTWHGGNSTQFILVWFFIALWTLVDPAFHQRCYAARSGEVARRGILLSVVFWVIFDAMTATAGLYARAVLPRLGQPVLAFPMLAEVTLPPLAKGLFYVGLLATIMSSLNTLAFVSATTLGRDLFWRLRPGRLSETRATQLGLIGTALLSIVVALAIPSVIKQWYAIGTVLVPGLLIPLVTSYFGRVRLSAPFAFWAMLAGCVTSSVWLLAGWTDLLGVTELYPLGIEPMYPGLVASAVVWLGGLWHDRRYS